MYLFDSLHYIDTIPPKADSRKNKLFIKIPKEIHVNKSITGFTHPHLLNTDRTVYWGTSTA